MIVALIVVAWIVGGTIAGIALGKHLRQIQHEYDLQDIYRRRLERERAVKLNGHMANGERVRSSIRGEREVER